MTIVASWRTALYAMVKRRSMDSSGRAASLRSRATTARRPCSSWAWVVCGCTRLLAISCCQLMSVSEDEQLRSMQRSLQKCLPSCELGSKFLTGVDSRIHRTVQTLLGLAQGRDDVGETHTADNHQINIAGCQFF